MQYIFRNTSRTYTAVDNEFIDDKTLSLKAKGLLLVILSNREDWEVYPNDLAKRSKDGIKSIYSGMKELEDAGYVRSLRISLGAKGFKVLRFCSDRKITDSMFEEFKNAHT